MNLNMEIRDGYTITPEKKKVWKVQLELLTKLLAVCSKYNLKIWAEGGTLLGTVRHNGYIPWDDDIDMVMVREDYDQLLRIADKEFTYPFFLQSNISDKGYYTGHAQLRNSSTTGILPHDIWSNKNQGIFIDIFVLDHMPDDSELIKKTIKEIIKVKNRLRLISYGSFITRNPFPYILSFIFSRFISPKVQYNQLEDNVKKLGKPNSKDLCMLIFSAERYQKYIYPSKAYKNTTLLPFEDIMMPVPSGYDCILKQIYGDYMTPVEAPSMHGTIIFDTDRAYNQTLKELRKRASWKEKMQNWGSLRWFIK